MRSIYSHLIHRRSLLLAGASMAATGLPSIGAANTP